MLSAYGFRAVLVHVSVLAVLSASPCVSLADEAKPDSGKYRLILRDNPVGTDTFTADSQGGSECDVALDLAGTKVTTHISVKAAAFHPTRIVTDAHPGGKLTLQIEGKKATATLEGAKTQSLTLDALENPYPYGNFTPHHLTGLLRAYDSKRGGAQKFNLVAVDSGVFIKVTLAAQETKAVPIAGTSVTVTHYLMSIAGDIGNVDFDLKADKEGRVLIWKVPSQQYVAIREGYEALAAPEKPTDSKLSAPTYEVKHESKVFVPMRDGVKLAADIYRPDAPGVFPVILQRTPYGREKALEATYYAKRGYVFVAQDVRGKFDSQGNWQPFVNEARDGGDSVQWCATQPWSNGNVGMIGGSYLGFVQWAAARAANPHLKCLIPIVSPPDPFFNIPYAYGTFFLWGDLWWTAIVDGKGMSALPKYTSLEPFKTLPLTALDTAVLGKHVGFFQEWLRHPTNDAYWQQVNFEAKLRQLPDLPALHISGWYDGDGIGTKRNYAAMVAAGQKHQRLIYGPWAHAVNTTRLVEGRDFGPQATRDLDTLYLRWFDHWLKGVDNGVEQEKPVEAFLMGKNEWRTFDAWPPREATPTKWYFRSQGHANNDRSDGLLSLSPPDTGQKPDRFVYDPTHPFIVPGFEAAMKATSDTDPLQNSDDPAQADLLTYTSAPLTADLVVAGPISVHLSAGSSAKDTDWYAMLEDITPDGNTLRLCQGILRARFRNGFDHAELLSSSAPVGYDLDLWATGNVFLKGHRLRVTVASSCFPLFDRNLNTGGNIATETEMVSAHQAIYHDPSHPSYIVLPTLPQ